MNRLAHHFQDKATDARVARMWGRVDEKLARAETRRPLRRGALALVFVAVAAAVLYFGIHARRALPPAQVVEFADGSRVEHTSADRVEVAEVTPERVELRMVRGHALFHVTPNQDRAFLTHALGYTIRVVGTEFTIDLGGGGVRVEVSRGEVEVRRDEGGNAWRVRAGETWSSLAPSSAGLVAPSDTQAPPGAPAEGMLALPPDSVAASVTPKGASPQPTPSQSAEAAALFQRAQDARAAGRTDETARLLNEFLRRFPNDARAGLAAFELGRIRLDSGDAKGAVDAFDQAGGAGNSFQEQVEARRVQALEQSGNIAACRAARTNFLRRFPSGSFAPIVRRRCP
jgi:hypothetical protein